LGRQYDLVDIALGLGKSAVDRKAAGNVAGVVVQFAACIDEQHVTVLQDPVPGAVVKNAAVGAAGHNAAVGHRLGTMPTELCQQDCLDFVLCAPGRRGLHGLNMPSRGNVGGLLHGGKLMGIFDLPQGANHLVEVKPLSRCLGAGPCLASGQVEALGDTLLRRCHASQGCHQPCAVFHQARQVRFQRLQAVGLVHVELFCSPLGPNPNAVPDFFGGVSTSAVEVVDVRPISGHQHHQPGIRLGKAGEEEEIAVAAKGKWVVAVAQYFLTRIGHDQGGLVVGQLGNRLGQPVSTGPVGESVDGASNGEGKVSIRHGVSLVERSGLGQGLRVALGFRRRSTGPGEPARRAVLAGPPERVGAPRGTAHRPPLHERGWA